MKGNGRRKKTETKWTATGISEDALALAKEMSEELSVTQREIVNVAIRFFHSSKEYGEMKTEMARVIALKEKYPQLFEQLTT